MSRIGKSSCCEKVKKNIQLFAFPYLGPGPAGYGLPPTVGYPEHDVRKDRKPMFSMRSRPITRYDTLGPGPARYGLGKMTRVGRPNNPSYSLAKRFSLFSKFFCMHSFKAQY